MTSYIEVHITTASEDEAELLANVLIEKKLAACVQVSGPIRSHYIWEGRTESELEWCCNVKTALELFPALVETVRANHSYKCPQIIVLPILAGNQDYLDWMNEQLQ